MVHTTRSMRNRRDATRSLLCEPEQVVVIQDDVGNRDAIALARLGKQQVLKRRFGLVSMVGLACGLMCTWETMIIGFLLGWQNGGSAGLVYGLLVIWIGNLSVWIVMGELSSMAPTAGGQYHWVSLMAPEKARPFLSFVAGWLTVTGWIGCTAGCVFFSSSVIQGLLALNVPGYDAPGWQGALLFWGVLLICGMLNTVLGKGLPAIEVGVLMLHILGFSAILVPMIYLTPSYPAAREVFSSFRNMGQWNTQTLSFFVGLNSTAMGFIGVDGAIHMAEEVRNAEINVARSMIISVMVNGMLSFAMLLMLLFYVSGVGGDITSNAPNNYPFIAIFAQGVGSNAGATGLTLIVAILEMFSATASLAAASRMLWSFARDRGLPGHRHLSKIDPRTTIPLLAVSTAIVMVALIGLFILGSSTVLNDVISLTVEAFYSSYLFACGLLLYRRVRGEIRKPDANSVSHEPVSNGNLQWGPWRLKGWLGIANNAFACVYLVLIAFFSFWPADTRPTAATMNYSSLVWGAVVVGSTVYYLFVARKTYNGPVKEVRIEQLRDA